jgi:hypothetical protein
LPFRCPLSCNFVNILFNGKRFYKIFKHKNKISNFVG